MTPGTPSRDRRFYRPGQIVPVSGIYTVIHQAHRDPHEALAIRGEEFPFCRICRDEVQFQVAHVVPHVTHDFDLAGPQMPIFKARAKSANRGCG
jgi:hypothetical protein